MKSQLSVDFVVTMVIFITFASYLSLQVLYTKPFYINFIKNERLKSELYQLSEVLINDPGYPENWEFLDLNAVNRMGLNGGKINLISQQKVIKFNETCVNNYTEVKKKLGVEGYDFSIYLSDKGGKKWIDCVRLTNRPRLNLTRIVSIKVGSTTTYGRLTLEMWET